MSLLNGDIWSLYPFRDSILLQTNGLPHTVPQAFVTPALHFLCIKHPPVSKMKQTVYPGAARIDGVQLEY